MEKLYNGIFECPLCGVRYEADDDPESELICECGEPLEPFEDDEIEDDEEDFEIAQ